MAIPVTIPVAMPDSKRAVLDQLVAALQQIPGVQAVALGGSYARGTQRDSSDLDIGIYYHEEIPFALDDVRSLARSVSVSGDPVVTGFYEWGAWVNGGAWIDAAAGKVDFLYRNLDQVQRTIDDAQQGISQHDFGQQPAYGFYSVIYLAETAVCIPLYDPTHHLARLKQAVAHYPPRLKARIMADQLWSAEFTLAHARTFAATGDVYNTVGCLTRIAASLTQVLFALNEVYFISDKQVMATLATFSLLPSDYTARIEALLAAPGAASAELDQTVAACRQLWADVVSLTSGHYQPRFAL
jgi:predicted nucleotidyltransferase